MRQLKSMIPKSGHWFSDKIMRQLKSMIPKSGYRFSDKIMRQLKSMIPKSGRRFSEKIMLKPKTPYDLPYTGTTAPRVTRLSGEARNIIVAATSSTFGHKL